MTQTAFLAGLFLLLLALVPLALRWARQRQAAGVGTEMAGRVVSVLAVGPQQRVVTVEVGPPTQRTWLVLGVTQQSVNCLHRMAADPQASPVSDAAAGATTHEA